MSIINRDWLYIILSLLITQLTAVSCIDNITEQ